MLTERDKALNKQAGFHPNNKSKWTFDSSPQRLKLCIECKDYKLTTEFNANSSKWDKLSNYCKPCQSYRNRYTPERRVHEKAHFLKANQIADKHKEVGCKKCGEKNKTILEFDHRNAKLKKYGIAELLSSSRKSLDKLIEELDKCDVLCRNCHRLRTFEQLGHGAIKRKHRQKLRAFIDNLKSNPCSDCDILYPSQVMDFDHLPQFKKEFTIASVIGKGLAKQTILSEVAKCELVCANCHKIRTISRLHGN